MTQHKTSFDTADEVRTRLDEVVRELSAKTVDEIAAFLLSAGHRGTPGHNSKCPLARYLTSIFPLPLTVEVGYQGLSVHVPIFGDIDVQHPYGGSIVTFVNDFDSGRFVELDESITLDAEPGQDV